jgi:hypothetical protein
MKWHLLGVVRTKKPKHMESGLFQELLDFKGICQEGLKGNKKFPFRQENDRIRFYISNYIYIYIYIVTLFKKDKKKYDDDL